MAAPVHNTSSLYRRTLGESFDSLPPVLKRFHEQPCRAAAQGTLCVTRGQGWVRRTLAALMRLPSPGEKVPVSLQVEINSDTERWTRQFGSLRLVTKQWLDRGLLMESAGPLRFGFRLTADAHEMRFDFARCWLGGLPLPPALSPRVHAGAAAYEDGWWVRVSVEVPVLGMLTRYEGKVTPQC